MKRFDYYYPEREKSKPFEIDYKTVTLGLSDADGNLLQKIVLKEKEAKDRKYSKYDILSKDFNEKQFKKDTKEFEKAKLIHDELFKNRQNEMLEDIAKENEVSVDMVKKAMKCLDFAVEEFCSDSLTEHITDHYSFSTDAILDREEFIFNKRVEYISSIITILK